ncbi:MAG: hypothetical protein QXO77_01520 [Saccharolobus sp.]
MSILEDPEFAKLRRFKNKIDINIVSKILDEIELDLKSSKNIKTSIIYIYSIYIDEVKKNKEFYDIVAEILQKYSQKIGAENVIELILNSIK